MYYIEYWLLTYPKALFFFILQTCQDILLKGKTWSFLERNKNISNSFEIKKNE